MSLAAGQRLGPYEVIARLGAGGMGEVFRAKDTRLGREVALKVLPADVAGDSVRKARFEQEARAVAALNHPNIVGVYDVGTQDGVFYLVTELVPGETLDAVLQRGPVPIKRLVDMGVQIADGMAAAHTVQITHRDLKPANVMVTGEGRVKILDFGLAKKAKPIGGENVEGTVTIHHTEAGMIVGTVNYMSPEQAAGKEVDPRSDQFSLGLILYEMITGKKAFERPSAVQTMSAILTDDPPRIERDIPLPLRWVIERCLAKEPADRYESSRDLYRDLRSLKDHLSQGSTSQVMAAAAAPAPRRKKLWMPALWFATGAIVALGAALLLGRTRQGPAQDAFRFLPFSFEPGGQANPTWSPDGKAVVYAARTTVTGRYELYIRYLDAPAPVQITKDALGAIPFAWTAKGRILFFSQRKPAGLWSIAPVGGQAEPVLELKGVNGLTISPDGSAVAVLHGGDDGQTGIWISSPPGAALKQYVPAPFATREQYNVPQARFSPDGKQLLLMINRKGSEEAWLMPYPADASKPPRQIWKDLQSFEGTPQVSWMPDNRRVVIATAVTPGSPAQLWMADTVSGDRTVLLGGTTGHLAPSVSPDGSRLVFSEAASDFDIISMSLTDASPTRLIATQRYESMPAWAAREQSLVYVTDRNGEFEIWLRKAGAGDRPLVTARDFPPGTTQWFMAPSLSPEGDRVIYGRVERSGPARLWISSVSGGAPIALTNEATSEFPGSWSPDGSWFAYYSVRDGNAALMKVKTSGQSAPVVLKAKLGPGNGSIPIWSPAGDWIGFEDGGIGLISPDGQNPKKLDNMRPRAYGFSSDGKSLFCLRDDQDGEQLLSIDIASGKEKVIGQVSRDFRPSTTLSPAMRLSLAPDGKSFVYPSGKSSINLWMMEGLSPKTGWF